MCCSAPRRRERAGLARAAASARARRPARRRPCARAGRRPRSPRTARPARPSACVSAHSALQCCSAMMPRGASDSVGSSRIIGCTSRKAPNSARRVAGRHHAVQALELGAHLAPSRGRSARSRRRRAPRNRVVRDLERRVRDELRAADGDAARDAEAVQREARHGATGPSPKQSAISATSASIASASSGPLGLERHLRALAGGEHHHAHDALGVDAAAVARHRDVALVLRRELRELGRRARVQAELVDDLNLALLHTTGSSSMCSTPSQPPETAFLTIVSMSARAVGERADQHRQVDAGDALDPAGRSSLQARLQGVAPKMSEKTSTPSPVSSCATSSRAAGSSAAGRRSPRPTAPRTAAAGCRARASPRARGLRRSCRGQ